MYCCYTTSENIVVFSKTVRQHTVHIIRLSSFSVKLLNLFLRTSGVQIILILILLTVEYGA